MTIYDPNDPGHVNRIAFNNATGKVGPYGPYDSIRYSGGGALYTFEMYTSILDDALNEFAGNGFATIRIDSQTAGQNVAQGWIDFAGHIESTEELVDELDLCVGPWRANYTVPINESGDFFLQIWMFPGRNDVYFSTWTHRLDLSRAWVPNDVPGASFFLNGT
jgi:hypothetical protein